MFWLYTKWKQPPSCHSGYNGAVGKQPDPDSQWQQRPSSPTHPCLLLSSLIFFCPVTCTPLFLFSVILSCQILPLCIFFFSIPLGANICLGYRLRNCFCVPEFVCNFFLTLQHWAQMFHCSASPIIPVKQEPVWFPPIHWETAGDPLLSH